MKDLILAVFTALVWGAGIILFEVGKWAASKRVLEAGEFVYHYIRRSLGI